MIYFYSFAPIFMVSAKCIDPWLLEFVVRNTKTNNDWTRSILLDLSFRGFS